MSDLKRVKEVFRRAATFSELLFYHKQIVDVYTLAVYGFVRKSEVAATCQSCHKQIKFDNDEPITQIKDPLKQALQNHDSGCELMNKFRSQELKINQSVLYDFASQFFIQIHQTHEEFQDSVRVSSQFWQSVFKNTQLEQWYAEFDKKFISKNIVDMTKLVSLFGWKRRTFQQLECYFCGQVQNVVSDLQKDKVGSIRSEEGFDCLQSHKSFCLIAVYNAWQIMLKKQVSSVLSLNKGDFQKTERQLKAKQLRDQCSQIYQQKCEQWDRLDQKIAKLVETYGNSKEESIKNSIECMRSIVSTFREEGKKCVKKIKLH